jgi:hypothetical protein
MLDNGPIKTHFDNRNCVFFVVYPVLGNGPMNIHSDT